MSVNLTWLRAGCSNEPFPSPNSALKHPNGLLAAGGDLHPQRLLRAYRQGIFPWYSADEPILWWSPNPRAVLRIGHLHRSRSLVRAWKRGDFAVTTDRAFRPVLQCCSREDCSDGVWLTAEMRNAYTLLHQLGHAHSVEIWRNGALIGGIYGLLLGRVFFGESMFSKATNASKFALIALEEILLTRGVVLLDGQVHSPHLMRMGFELWPRPVFLQTLHSCSEPPLIDSGPKDSQTRTAAWAVPASCPQSTNHLPASVST